MTKYTLNNVSKKLYQYTIYSIIFFTLIIIFLLKWNQNTLEEEALKRAFIYTKVGFDKDVIYRRWVSGHGGVYVPVTKETPPNPYLSHIKNRDVFIDSVPYTLVNPAYMSRQVYELENATSGSAHGHITSLKPIRPENKADEWETKVLHMFEKGTKEFYEIDSLKGKVYFRYMKPFIVENSCLKCHAHQDYKIGDIRGGISISYPLDDINILNTSEIKNNFFTHFIIWIIGIVIIIIAFLRIKKSNEKQLIAESKLILLNRELEERIENRTAKLKEEIDNRKKAEDFLQKSEEKFRTLYNNSPDMYLSVSPEDACILECNNTFLKKTNYTRDEVIGFPIFKMYHDDCMDDVKKAFQQFVETGKVSDKELIIKTKNGDKIAVSLNVNAVKDETGKILYSISSWRDITESNKIKETIEKNTNFIESIINASPDIIYIYDILEQKNVFINDGMQFNLGYTDNEIKEMSDKVIPTLMHPEDFDSYLQNIVPKYSTMLDKEIITHEYRMKDKAGNWHWLNSKESVFLRTPNGEAKQIFGISNDITEQKKATATIEKNAKLLTLFVEHSPASIAMFDNDMKYIVASNRFKMDYDLGEQNLVGHSHYEIFPEISDPWKEIHQRCLAGETLKADEDQFPRASGKLDWVKWEIRPWYENYNKIGGIIIFSEVITERKKIELELLKYSEHLEELVKERTQELEEKNQKLYRINRLFVDRELRMKELKEEIEKLKNNYKS